MDRQRVIKAFQKYTEHYNPEDGKIKLKIDHTYRVAALCERIAKSLGMSEEDVDLAWLCGMLHDIGRFEQIRNFQTFKDADSIDHAHYGVWVLFGTDKIMEFFASKDGQDKEELKKELHLFETSGSVECAWTAEGRIDRFLEDDFSVEPFVRDWSRIVATAIWNHSAYRIEEGLDNMTEQFCHILRDADKIDILKVNHDIPMEVIYDVPEEVLKEEVVTEEVMEQYRKQHAILRSAKKTCVDHIVGHIALAFELIFDESVRIVKEQGYLERLFDFKSNNMKTKEQFGELKERMEFYMESRLLKIQ